MPVAADLIVYLPVNTPEDDVVTTGGARSATARPLDSQFSAAAVVEVDSDNAGDTMNVTVEGRLASGAVATEVIALTGTTAAAGATSFLSLLNVTLASAATGTVTIAQGVSGTIRHTFAPGELFCAILFQRSTALPAASEEFYEKVFWENSHATEALLTALLQLSADPSSLYEVGVAATVDDTLTAANRLAAPAGITFVDDGVDQAVPGTDLAALNACGQWVRQTLATAEAASLETFTTQIAGSSI